MRFISRFSVPVILFFFSITSFSQEPEDILAKRTKSIDTYGEKGFVVNISDIVLMGDHIVIVDQDLAKIIITNRDFSEWEIFGTRGDGPKEFKKPYMFWKDDLEGVLYVYDNEKFRFWPIDIERKSIGKGTSFEYMLFKQSVAIENSNIYFATIANPEIDVIKYSLSRKKKTNEIDLHENSVKSFLGRYVFNSQDKFVVVTPYDGLVIDTYDKNWNFLSTKDLTKHPIVDKLLSKKQSRGFTISGESSGNIRMTPGRLVMRGARAYGNELYLLLSQRDKFGKSRANVILKYVYDNNNWEPNGKIILPEKSSYATFELQPEGNKLIAFDRENGTIDLFEIK